MNEVAKQALARTSLGVVATAEAAKAAGATNNLWLLEGIVCKQCKVCQAICYSTDSLCRECLSERLDWKRDLNNAQLQSFTHLYVSFNDFYRESTPWSIGLVDHTNGLRFYVFLVGEIGHNGAEVMLFTAPDMTGQAVLIAIEPGGHAKEQAENFAAELAVLGMDGVSE